MVTFRLTKGVKRRLERVAAQRKLNLSEYVERAIEAQLAYDQIPAKLLNSWILEFLSLPVPRTI